MYLSRPTLGFMFSPFSSSVLGSKLSEGPNAMSGPQTNRAHRSASVITERRLGRQTDKAQRDRFPSYSVCPRSPLFVCPVMQMHSYPGGKLVSRLIWFAIFVFVSVLRVRSDFRTAHFCFLLCAFLSSSQLVSWKGCRVLCYCAWAPDFALAGFLSLAHLVVCLRSSVLARWLLCSRFCWFLDIVVNASFCVVFIRSLCVVNFEVIMFTFLFWVFLFAVDTSFWPIPVFPVSSRPSFGPCLLR